MVALSENLGAVGRNIGVRELGTPYVAFCDDDTWWEPGSLSRVAELLATDLLSGGWAGPHRARDRTSARAVWDAIRGLRWLVRQRRPRPPAVQARLAPLDAAQRRSAARRYVG